MKIPLSALLFLPLGNLAYSANADPMPITENEAATIVQNQEEAKEAAKDERLIELQSAEILESAVAEFNGRRVVFNRVPKKAEDSATVEAEDTAEVSTSESSPFFNVTEPAKDSVTFVLSGNVWDDGVSELWWDYDGIRYRIFTNANCLLFSGIADIEDETTRYSILSLLVQRSFRSTDSDDAWVPTASDFLTEHVEYFVMAPSDEASMSDKAFSGIEAMLRHYVESEDSMRINYDNALKMRDARAAYLKANPPEKRPTWINFRPTGKSAERFQR